MPDSFETQNSRQASQPNRLDDGAELLFHAGRDDLLSLEEVHRRRQQAEHERPRQLTTHEEIGLDGSRIDHFRLWEQELAEERDFALWERELTEARDFAQWEREMGGTSALPDGQAGYELTGGSQ